MKKYALLLATVIVPLFLWAQDYYAFLETVPRNTQLLRIQDGIVMIQPTDYTNEAHKWLTFDTTLRVVAAKKLVTPNATEIIGQTYLEGNNTVIRIDQSIVDDIFFISAYVFDNKGNILKKQDVDLASAAKRRLLPSPFYILQSPDKQYISLVQLQKTESDSLLVSAISISEALATKTSKQFSIPYLEDLQDVLTPVNDNNGDIYLLTADRFNSYRLGSTINGYVVSGHDEQPRKISIPFNRKKLRDFHFQTTDSSLHFSALFNEKQNKEDIGGILYASFNVKTAQLVVQKEMAFQKAFKESVNKQFSREGRKGNILNYLVTLPHSSMISDTIRYGVLLPALEKKPSSSKTTLPKIDNGLHEVRNQLAYINSLVGTIQRGDTKPLSHADALILGGGMTNHTTYENPVIFKEKAKGPELNKQTSRINNLLLLDADKNDTFAKINMPTDPDLQFFTYFPSKGQYSTLYYSTNSFGRPILKSTSISAAGMVTEKTIFEHKDRIVLSDYPYTVSGESLIAFYQDRNTGQMGLIKINLQ